MDSFWFFGTGAAFVAAFTISMDRIGLGAGGRRWAISWPCLYLSGLGSMVPELAEVPIGRIVYPILGTFFAFLMVGGSLRFIGRPVPRWLLIAAFAVAISRSLGQLLTPDWVSQLTGGTTVLAAGFASAWLVMGEARRSRSGWAWTLVGALGLAGLTGIVYAFAKITSSLGEPALIWLTAGPLVATAQLAALFDAADRRMREGRLTLDALVDAVPVGLALSDASETVRSMNDEFARQLEARPSSFIGHSLSHVVNQARAVVRSTSADSESPGRDQPLAAALRMDDTEVVFDDGRIAVVTARTVHGRSPGRPAIGHLWFLRDVTEERHLETELNQARQLETLARLAGGVAHDFNNKLTSVLGNAALLRESLQANDWRSDSLRDLEQAAEYCAELTRDLLDFARPSTATATPIAPEATLERIAEELRSGLPAEISLSVSVEPDAPLLLADPTQFERVVTNLVLNARDACEATASRGGQITMIGRACSEDSHSVEICVRDDGTGMDEPTRSRMFDPFYSTKGVGSGTGLGLAIVFGVVSAHGGRIEVETELGKGTTFVTRWPSAGRGSDDRRTNQAHPNAIRPRHSESVLVVEDEGPVRRVLRAMLERDGYHVLEAQNGEDAVALAERRHAEGKPIHVAVVDLEMPGLSGAQTIDRLRKEVPDVAAVMVSGHFGGASPATHDSANPNVVRLAKPFRPIELVDAVARALDSQRG